MAQGVEKALEHLRDLGSPAQIEALAKQSAGAARLKNNAHIHLPPNFSAFESVEQAVTLAAQQDVSVLGVSNYYDYDVYGDFADLAWRKGIFPLFGLEIIALIDQLVRDGVKINDPGNPGKIYICGKGITRFADMTPEAQRLLGIIRRNDAQRMAKMIEKVNDVFAQRGLPIALSESDIIDRIVARHGSPRERVYLQERHLCQAFQERLFESVPASERIEKLTKIFGSAPKAGGDDAVKIQNEIRSHLMKAGKSAFVEETFVTFEQAHRLILELGGIPCYPTLADGTRPICPFEEPVEQLIERIRGMEVFCAELIPIRNLPAVLSSYVKAMRAAGLLITAGTEHNTLDLLPIEPQCAGGVPIPQDVADIFWEGACVVAAHQFLTLHGKCGFVDASGKLNPAYRSDDSRIAAFREIGAAVITRYRQQNSN